jgi:hypothetical protein
MAGETSEWRKLLGLALPALDYVFGTATNGAEQRGKPDWTLGGGTAIMIAIGHRVSHDIDVFVHGARLKRLSPHENPAARRISTLYDWPGHYLKFHRPEGEIDFLGGILMTEPGFGWRDMESRRIALETPEEVMVRKLAYRAPRLPFRDAFDLAAVDAARPDIPALLAEHVPGQLPRLVESLRALSAMDRKAQEAAIIPLEAGAPILPDTLERSKDVVSRAMAILERRRMDAVPERAKPESRPIDATIELDDAVTSGPACSRKS